MKQRIVELLRIVGRFLWKYLRMFGTFLLNFLLALWRERIFPWLKALTFKKAMKIMGYCFAGGVLFVIFLFVVLSFNLPTVEALKDYKPSPGTTIYAEDGRVVGKIRIEKGVYVPLQKIPKYMKDAILATEDPRFYEHSGIDYRGILRAALKNIVRLRISQGGSTITQQLTKVVFLSPERSFIRKIREIILARRLEKEISKEEILELYLN